MVPVSNSGEEKACILFQLFPGNQNRVNTPVSPTQRLGFQSTLTGSK
uniref:Uncharacterized protein n=1 Tax=Anguilla anguilla TaxID=7936 RepID=A0A0E9R977_ANGAN